MKECNCCGELKSTSEFHRSSSAKDGLQHRCKVCNNSVNREYHLRQGAIIYVMENLQTGDTYVGSTSKRLGHRKSNHFSDARCGMERPLSQCIRDYPHTCDWEMTALHTMDPTTTTIADLRLAEQAWIEALNPTLNCKRATSEEI
jgi:hypothetical protein